MLSKITKPTKWEDVLGQLSVELYSYRYSGNFIQYLFAEDDNPACPELQKVLFDVAESSRIFVGHRDSLEIHIDFFSSGEYDPGSWDTPPCLIDERHIVKIQLDYTQWVDGKVVRETAPNVVTLHPDSDAYETIANLFQDMVEECEE